MNTANYPVYDFVTASKVERPLSIALKNWLAKFNARFVERWAEFSAAPVQVSTCLTNAMSFDAARGKWTTPTIACPISIKGRDKNSEVQGLILANCADMILLVLEILSETVTTKPAERELTSIEISMSQLLFQTATAVLGEAWLDKDPLPVSMAEFDFQPNNSRLFAPSKEVIITGFEIHTASSSQVGPARIEWVLGKEELMNLLGVKPRETQAPAGGKIDPALVNLIQIELEASLGSTELSMASLLQLAPGAIICLDQRVDEPLVVNLNGVAKLTAWPGVSHHHSCIMIESLLN